MGAVRDGQGTGGDLGGGFTGGGRAEAPGSGGRGDRRQGGRGVDRRASAAAARLGGEAELAEDRRGEAFAAWRHFFEALAERRPLVLVFEDVQWADDASLDFVDHLVDWSSGVPLLVACTARPELLERRPGWGGGKRNAVTVSLDPLS
ncbi:MAG: hypothetical protein E6G67_11475, partial [Actinobacteria bacterium]